MAVGNVSETLAPYTKSDTFLSRDGRFSWQAVPKEPTDHVLFTTYEELTIRLASSC
ncbi:hypothetical protein EDC04DRAFT_2767589 [Pisolithus marmoratus]|nr:hypothetical protein EDC04DRAFT_2767589 [Pisolithus marmoratus]